MLCELVDVGHSDDIKLKLWELLCDTEFQIFLPERIPLTHLDSP